MRMTVRASTCAYDIAHVDLIRHTHNRILDIGHGYRVMLLRDIALLSPRAIISFSIENEGQKDTKI